MPQVQLTPPSVASATPTLLVHPPTVQATPTLDIPGGPWRLAWSDEFEGPAGAEPDASKWSPLVGGNGQGNHELEYNTSHGNAFLDGSGDLVLEARRSNPEHLQCWYGPCQYTSAALSTDGHYSFTYGYIEARMKIPAGLGMWSAFWLLGANCDTVGWPACGEVDIMENIAQEPATIHGTIHGPAYFTSQYTLPRGNFADDYHTFGLDWDPDHMFFYVDGKHYATLNRTLMSPGGWVYNHAFNIVISLPVGGDWPGTPPASTVFPKRFLISYVRVYTA